ncbi:phasin family protein [Herminiimonas fonticola]|uniref:Poly(Hydroxyalkanoate) granule-associated protein n=1 Tax=Herminiimonas fonticola TaxID=303380 RepID=A0A4R6G6G6_9BURK|nr:phasin family protein [Herminiimonas fonticola]RBA24087.1 Poly(hydroxyalcanoate) granule associated protein (phasin) [Herminiimonas fonticola]TDN90086.1 poly(hydroxyalkanoate) granule-associated protein [Herminiimonas fonticola]
MAKKLNKTAKSNPKQVNNGVHASAQQIWQAGLDALAKTQREGGKVISRLAKEGSSLQKRTRKIAEEKASDLSDGFLSITGSVGKQASDSWEKLEQVIEQTVTRSLISLGLSTQKELQALHKRIDGLTKSAVKKAADKKPTAKKATAKKAVKKTATKKVALKKVTVKPAAKKKTVAKKTATRTPAKAAK